jgi:hypothetical protein
MSLAEKTMVAMCFIFSRLNASDFLRLLKKDKAKFVQSNAESREEVTNGVRKEGSLWISWLTSKRFESEPAGILKKAQSPRGCAGRKQAIPVAERWASHEEFMEHAREEQDHAD